MNNKVTAMRDVFLEKLIFLMENNQKIFFVTADFGSPVLDKIREYFPDRFINVGIAEQNLINVSTGLALEGYTVYAYAIAPFITMRCYEQIRVNIAILSQVRPMNINLIGVGAGYSYVVSGPTHQCLEDISIMRTLPNVEVFSPSDSFTVEKFVQYSANHNEPKYIRLDAKPLTNIYTDSDNLTIDNGFSEIKKGNSVCIISTGYMTHNALEIAQELEQKNINVGLIDLFLLRNFDKESLIRILKKYSSIITYEEGFSGKGGLDSLISFLLNEFDIIKHFIPIGLNDKYNFELGDRDYLHEICNAGKSILLKKVIENYEK